VFLKPYWGNSGDSLIRLGNAHAINELGLDLVADHREADVIIWPGGNPTMWSHQEGWEECIEWACGKEFAVAPATFRMRENGGTWDWESTISNATCKIGGVFARDKDSYEELKAANLPSDLRVGLGHDPAFQLRGSEFIEKLKPACCDDYALACFRDDHERSAAIESKFPTLLQTLLPGFVERRMQRAKRWKEREQRRVLFESIKSPRLDALWRDASTMDFDSFVECCRRAGEVHTDRLHCMILAALLEKKIFSYSTSYGKLEAVISHSLDGWSDIEIVEASEVR